MSVRLVRLYCKRFSEIVKHNPSAAVPAAIKRRLPKQPPKNAYTKNHAARAIDQALAESHEQGIHGKETTPFLLARVAELTGGDSLESNIQLVLNNARVAAKTAVALCK